MAPIEIERKWMVTGWPEMPEGRLAFEQKMRQGYVSVRPTVRIREEETTRSNRAQKPLQDEFILCFKSKGRLSRKEVELSIPVEKFRELEDLIGEPLIEKVRRTYELSGGLSLEVNHVDAGLPTEFWYAEVEFASEEAAKSFIPADYGLGDYLVEDVTELPGQSMGEYWETTRLHKTDK
ncbi:hypothetical protein [Selenomonas sp. ND2010]|jgi:CYTH domain-containing protein|uniref:hypothetical protein n=1 Tax=Selenomonas sp. ND2010 TaxID=1410618 RepID=UPI000AE179F9|nr:hypothetical protein [Selenomonas sp. ND2010]